MSENSRQNTGANKVRTRLRQFPLANVAPLKRKSYVVATSEVVATKGNEKASGLSPQSKVNSVGAGTVEGIQSAASLQDNSWQVRSEAKLDVATAQTVPLDGFPLPRYEPPEERKLVVKPKNWFKLTSRFIVGGIAVVFLLSSFFVWHSYSRASAGLAEAAPSVAILSSTSASPEKLIKEGDARINILLLGVGGEGHAGADLTDTMVLASIDPVNKTATLLSIPRDLWVTMPNGYFGNHQKINAVYSAGKYSYYQHHGKTDEKAAVRAGLAAVDGVVEQVTGVPIQYHALIDFTAFKQAVDSVGGVTVDVKEQLYDPTMAWETNYNPVLAAVGLQTMDGKRALNYARSRETSSDFARSERQRQLLVALKEKVLTMETLSSPTKITSLMNAFGENVHTDFSTQAASRLFSIGKDIKSTSISSLSLTAPFSLVTTDHVGNISVVRPKAGFDTYSDIQAYVRSQLKDGYLIKENANVYVVGATEALRSQTEQTLKNYGYVVSGSSVNATVSGGTSVIDKSAGKSPYTLHYLRDRYNSAETKTLPAGLVVPNDAQFVIIAGT